MRNLILFLLCFPLCAYSQMSIKIGASAGLLYSHPVFKVHDQSPGSSIFKRYGDETLSGWGAFYSLNCILFKRKWLFETGIVHTTSGYRSIPKNLRFGDRIDEQFGFVQTSAPVDYVELKFVFNNIRIPVLLGYAFTLSQNKRHKLIPQLGVSNNLLYKVQNELLTNYTDGSRRKEYPSGNQSVYKAYSVSALGGLTYMYEIKRLGIAATCFFNQYLTPTALYSDVTEYEYFGTAKIGVFYTLY